MTALPLPPGLILAGGRSSRMGEDKSALTLGTRPMLDHILDRLKPQVSSVALNAPAGAPNPQDLRLIADTLPGQPGPLAGVLAGLRDVTGPHLVTVPSDSPFFPQDLVARLLSATRNQQETIAIASSGGQIHPVFGLWPVSIADDLEHWISDSQNRRVRSFLERHRMVTVDFEFVETANGPLDPFFNVNTPEDLQMAHRFAELLT